ncbi:hypothetical protein DY000_02057418 [Brassica cretica]|uniref:Uncharacterized protein n=1 Tax=Brassica cretica TaxID=69181 RepID=A0ABQ7AF78_BRACR|nr:hypothetical protein DY000_02057418 [Brassica cretica]
MAEAFTFTNLHIPSSSSYLNEKRGKNLMRGSLCVRKALPHDLPLMAVMVQQIEGMRDIITEKHVWHLSDKAIKNVYLFYIMFTCWGCLYFGSAKDPFYDSEEYRGDGGDGTGYWVYETIAAENLKQNIFSFGRFGLAEDIEEKARAELWREELIEEIEQKVGGLRELEEAVTK